MKNWKHTDNQDRGLVNSFSEYINGLESIGKIFLPDLRESDDLFFFSDYSGNHKGSDLFSYSILVLDGKSFESFVAFQKEFWEAHSLENRIIDYKGLGDKVKAKALIPFLKFCNNINGLILSVIVPKKVKSIFLEEKTESLKEQLSVWRSLEVQEKFLRLMHFVILILNGLGRSNQSILWVTDNDDIVSNETQLVYANAILKERSSKHISHKLHSIELSPISNYLSKLYFEKLCSVPDLVTGALADFLSDYQKAKIYPNEGEIARPILHSKLKVNPVTNWLSKNEDECKLKKITLSLEESDSNGLLLKAYRFPEILNFQA